MNEKIKRTPEEIFEEHSQAVQYKASIGDKGVFEQTKRNERFYNGDQWHGAKVGNDRPLVRHNVIKRIGDYKLSVLGASPLSVNFTADGIPNTLNLRNRVEDETEVDFYEQTRKDLANGDESKQILDSLNEVDKINVVMDALGDYFNVCSERMKFTTLCEQVLKNSYISGTGVLFTYWDSTIKTGLYADKGRTMPIDGDIVCEVIDIENVDFGDTSEDDVQKQPYIIISQRQSVAELKRQARRNGRPEHEVAQITPDSDYTYMSGDLAGNEPSEAGKCTVLTKVWKEYNKTGTEYVVKAIKVCEKAVIKDEWDIGVKIYPISKFAWEKRRNCTYGESEITYLVPNQIAINRMLTASVWAVMMMGMPIMMVNSDVINQPLTNNPGQVVRFSGSAEDFNNAISYVSPPNFSPNFDQNIQSLISNTLSSTGAYDAALGDVAPTNTSAIMQQEKLR